MDASELKVVLEEVKSDFAKQLDDYQADNQAAHASENATIQALQDELSKFKTSYVEINRDLYNKIAQIMVQNTEFTHVKDLLAALENYKPTVVVEIKSPEVVIPEPAAINLEPLRELLEQFKPHLVAQMVEQSAPNQDQLQTVQEQLKYAEYAIETRDAKIAELEQAVQTVKLQAQEMMAQIPIPSDPDPEPVAADDTSPSSKKPKGGK